MDSWHELYEAREAIIAEVANRLDINKGKVYLEDQRWGITKDQAVSLADTLSHHRHNKGAKPSLNMDEAREIMRSALRGWLKDTMP